MTLFKYRAKKGPQEFIEGTIEAKDKKEAVEKLSNLGYLPLSLEEELSTTKRIVKEKTSGRISKREITLFSRQLASLLKSGFPILQALSILREQTNNAYFRFILRNIYEDLKEGKTLSSSLEKYPKIFPQIYVALVRAGEGTGNLFEILFRIADYRKKEQDFLSRIRMSLAYPAFMAVLGVITIVFMFTFVIPRLSQIFLNIQESLPLPTRILISLSKFFKKGIILVLFFIFIIIIFFRKELRKNPKLRLSFSKFKLTLPIFGKFILKSELSRFAEAMAVLIKNGIPILKALELAVPILNNELLKEEVKKSASALVQGGSFGRTLKESKIIPIFMSNLISVGEEAGELELALTEIAEIYEQDTYETMQVFTNLLEPLLILVMGLVIGFIVVAMLLPIFQISALK